ncbi:MAG: FAD:protein FMN transferase [Candidatus Thioglobus sp.]|nr:MAG: FAD:protein FMN transferase [Candidatus Thioglobus sp.]
MNLNITKLYPIIAILLLASCSFGVKMQTFSGSTMGTTWTLKTTSTNISQQKIEERLKQINAIFSTWDASSELSALNQYSVGEWFPVSKPLFYLLQQSQQLRRKTNGYFDPGIGRLIDIWGFGTQKITQKPSKIDLQQAFKNSSIRYLLLRDGQNRAVKKTQDIQINLSAIAKGYAVDALAELDGGQNYLIEIGGEVLASGNNQGNSWTVGIEKPDHSQPIAIKLNNQAIATSGDYRNYFSWNGKRYQHIFNPQNPLPTSNDLSSVSVIHPQAMIADAYATALLAMGKSRAIALAKKLKLSVILILSQQQNFKVLKINQQAIK